MPAERYFSNAVLQLKEAVELIGAEFHHLAHVMRARNGDPIELVNGRGVLAQAVVDEIKKDRARLTITNSEKQINKGNRIILAQALSKYNRLDFILEKGTELGVDEFWLFPGDHSIQKEWYPSHQERAQTVLISAIKQCGRLFLPQIDLKPRIEEWDGKTLPLSFFGDIDSKAPLFELVWKDNPVKYPVLFITGPEGGFSEREEQKLRLLGSQGVKLHDNILRTETASLMALSLLSHWELLD